MRKNKNISRQSVVEKQSLKKHLFENFSEFWKHVRILDDTQREIIFSSLPKDEQEDIQSSYDKGGWEDLFMRNKLDKLLDKIKKDTGLDLIDIRCRVVTKNKSVYINKDQWNHIYNLVHESVAKDKKSHLNYILGGMKATEENKETILLIKK